MSPSSLVRRPSSARGFTLLEVLLAMSLSVLVLAAVGTAIHIHLHMVDVGRSGVEQAQLARAILARIAEDLRASIQYEPPDTSGLQVAALNSSASDALNAVQGPSAAGSSSSSKSSSSSSSDSSIADSAIPGVTPGVYGSQFEIQMDVSRLPRLDQYGATAQSSAAVAPPPTDVKTIAYYLRSDTTNGPAGLVRREVARAATFYAAEQGTLADLDVQAELLAPEVTDIEFVYYDGTTTYSEWDSNAKGSLPIAVEVIITLAIPAGNGTMAAAANANYLDDEPVYRMLVCLPSSHPADSSSSSSSSTSSDSDTSSTPPTP